ncbi:MAG: TolC family protein [Planctomycetaceae bacterium]
MKTNRWKRSSGMVLLLAMLGQGCAGPGSRLQYLIGEDRGLEHYEGYATSIEYPTQCEPLETNPELLRGPRSITSLEEVDPREMTLNECIRMALANAEIIVDDQSFGSPSNPLMGNPGQVASVWDNAIQDTGFLFGNLGPEAALSNFDPILTSSLQGGASEDPQNTPNIGIPAGGTLEDNTAQFQTRLEKTIATAGTLAVEHDVNYSRSNQTRLFNSAYTGFLQAEYRQPLLAGSGVEFTRIAGPQQSNVRGVSGVAQGVLISRINSDISLLQFEQSVTTLLRDVENRYWDLYLFLQLYDSEIETAQDFLRFSNKLDNRDSPAESVLQAESRFYEGEARIKGSLGDVIKAEYRLRRLLGLPLNDGTFITPIDVPSAAKLELDWESCLLESLSHRNELRRQKWEIRSLELQYKASQNLARPRLDFVSQYRVNGLGDNLFGNEDDDGSTDVGYNSFYESLSQGENTSWTTGMSFTLPVGLRLARAQVRNYELRLRKAHAVLARQEVEVGYELSDAMINMEQNYLLAESGMKKAAAAKGYAEATALRADAENANDPIILGRVLDARISSRDADQGYLKLIVDYNKAITELNFRKGTILQTNSIYLAEGEWNPEAYDDARIRGEAMSRALDNAHLQTVPEEFVAGPDVNSWESLGNPSRPFEPGAIENVNRIPPTTFESQPGIVVPDVPAINPQGIAEPLQTTPNATEEPKMPIEPVKPGKADDFLDPVNYQSQLAPESKTSSRPLTSKAIREFRNAKRNPTGRAQLD